MPSRRFLFALALSLLLHAALIGLPGLDFRRGRDFTPVPLDAHLLPAPATTGRDPPAALLKDTLTDESQDRTGAAPTVDIVPSSRQASPADAPTPAAVEQRAARRKLAERRFYPPQAVAQGIEGEVRLRLTLDAEGRVVDVQIAAGSGHSELDRAAVQAAYSVGPLPGIGVREMILPVVFRLQ